MCTESSNSIHSPAEVHCLVEGAAASLRTVPLLKERTLKTMVKLLVVLLNLWDTVYQTFNDKWSSQQIQLKVKEATRLFRYGRSDTKQVVMMMIP